MVTAAWAGAANPIVKPASAVAAAAPPATRRAKAPPLVLIMLCPPWTHAGTRRARHPDHPPWRPVETQFYRITARLCSPPGKWGQQLDHVARAYDDRGGVLRADRLVAEEHRADPDRAGHLLTGMALEDARDDVGQGQLARRPVRLPDVLGCAGRGPGAGPVAHGDRCLTTPLRVRRGVHAGYPSSSPADAPADAPG